MKLERLYKKSKTGAVVYCDISTDGNIVTVEAGQVGTDKPVFHTSKCEAKNVGKASATTPKEQADKEALANYAKKIKGGYVLDESGETNIKLAMKVKVYQEQKKNVVFPAWMSPKLDGVNGEFRCEDDWHIMSRTGEYPIVDSVNQLMIKGVAKAMAKVGSNALNGELYKHGLHLQDIQACTAKANEDTYGLQFHIFEICDSADTFENKIDKLRSIEENDFVKVVPIVECNSHEEIEAYHTKCVDEGYEGIIVRNSTCVYEYGVRSSDVFKFKIAKDAEYRVVGYELDKYGHAVWICACNDDNFVLRDSTPGMTSTQHKKYVNEHTFSVKKKGTASERLAEAAIADTKIGSWLKIEFESYSKLNKPLKPVGIVWRDCDENGEPLV